MVLVKKYKLSLLSISLLFFTSCGGGSSSEKNHTKGEPTVELSMATLPFQTGQEKSYDIEGNIVTDGMQKDDGFYKAGVVHRYTRNNTLEIVEDTITGLMWQDNNDTVSVGKPWLSRENYRRCIDENNRTSCFDTTGDTAFGYCSVLVFGGYDDWRLPDVKELESLIDYSHIDSSLVSIFQHRVSRDYWSSTDLQSYIKIAWSVDFKDGRVDVDTKDYHNLVRCVRE